jgi:SpoIID/LytB domain protein
MVSTRPRGPDPALIASARRPARRPGRRSLARVIRLAATVALGAAVLGTAAPAAVAAPLGNLTFYGRGYGHGVGMSQYGARGRALAGQLAPAILAHYYAKTTLGTRDPKTVVRVLVLNAFAATPTKPAVVTGRGGTWTVDGLAGTFPADARLTVAPTAVGATTWNVKVLSATGATLATSTTLTNLYVRPASASSVIEITSKAAPWNRYRGYLRIKMTTTVLAIDFVGVDAYLGGVVPVEMPSTWPVEALKVQAIASRSYALNHTHPTTGTWDLYDDTRSQVYRGQGAETAAGNAAVAATAGKVVLSGTAVANTLYHSADGGWTENNENVFVSSTGAVIASPVSYLRGSSDRAPDGSSYDKASPYATWKTATYSPAALSGILAKDARTNVGTLTAIDLSKRGVSGRLIAVTLTGSLGTKQVSGDVFIAAFNAGRPAADPPMRDTLFSTAPLP